MNVASTVMRWQRLDPAEREREYSPSSCLPDDDYRPFVAEYRRRSDEAWRALIGRDDVRTAEVRYGDTEAHRIDVAVPTRDAPVPLLAFVHGGYWQELSAADSRFAAVDCCDRGWAFAAVDYTLAPEATIDEIVDECRRAHRALVEEAEALGIDPDRVVITGSSAGAHLAAMVALDPGPVAPAALALISGVYELEPLIGTSIDGALGLDVETAHRNSPLLADVAGFPPTLLAIGSDETAEFSAQLHDFAAHLAAADVPVSLLEIDGRNHFDVVLDLADPTAPLGRAVGELVEPYPTRRDDTL